MPDRDRSSLPTDLEAMLAPLSTSEFIKSHWAKSFCYIPGWAGKFAELLRWEQLNRILEQHRPDSIRFELIMAGQPIDPHTYIDYSRSVPTIIADEFNAQLRAGATLVLDEIQELHTPLATLAQSLELRFGVPVGINTYAGWRTSHGLTIHSDNHDVFILQVSGNKRWLLYGDDAKVKDAELPPDPLWDRELQDGDLLYIPRGCRHVAIPLDQPCLHLTVSVANRTATDFLVWMAAERRFQERVDMQLSRLAPLEERLNFIARVRCEVSEGLSVEMLDRYFEDSDAGRRPLSHLSLPWSATPLGLPLDNSTLLRLASRRILALRTDREHRGLQLTFNGKVWRYTSAMKVLFDALADSQPIKVGRLLAVVGDTLGEDMARAFIGTLIKDGIVWIVPPSGSNL
jgi:ribosomal protein L16 Arg81 hydroxylase